MTILRSIFQKPVDRTIEGVIKADDEASLRLEIEEYVLTNEVEKRLELFLEAYNNYEGANGVWVSGFFGSGKSHLLKMLALLLENREIDGVRTLDLFLPKCNDNEILRGDLKRAVAIPSRSILFNIDQKADVISKTQFDALLAVFVKVFDETCGYYGKHGHIAQFERDLDSRNQYDAFKQAYEHVANRPWQKGREQALLEAKNIAIAYAKATGSDESAASGILDKYRTQYRLSIEDFAEQVSAYIERQPPGFRLNFFVDEAGQYIADNIKLMTNLQTIAESLATKCRGRAWVIVTAQEDMGSVIGEMGKQQGNDFSKIQARFANRMKLTSQNVDEVIQKRLLTKTEAGTQMLSDVYHEQSNNFKTLFDFADGSQTYRNFQDRDHFIHCYPFIPYQFALFQSAIQNLSQHNAFEGKHSSVGERSMLGVFQQVAIQIGDHEVGQLATFDLMFEGIRTALKANIQRAVLQAENHLDNPFAVRLLKALFLVKYVKEFKPTVRNLCVLMLEGFNQNLPALRKRVEEALNLLEQQTYIQRNGEVYEYLTDEEKDVEQEIKNTEVETSQVGEELEKIIFDQIIKHRKIRYDDNGQDYPFSRKLDDRPLGREYELGINIITPFHEHSGDENILRMQSMGKDELVVVMPADDRLVRDILMYKRTEKYIRQNLSVVQQESIKRILSDKGHQNRERLAELQVRVQDLLGRSGLLMAGSDVEINHGDAQNRIVKGFHQLITRAYPNLRMLRGHAYTEQDIARCLDASQESLFGNDTTTLAESEQEMLAFIQRNSGSGIRTTLKSLVERFEKRPYGWYLSAILCTLAKLCTRGKVDVRSDSNSLEPEEIERALRNTHGYGNVLLEPQVEYSGSQVRALKEFYAEFFDSPATSGEAIALAKEALASVQKLKDQLAPMAEQSGQYPFLAVLAPVLEKLDTLGKKPHTWFLTDLSREEDALLDLKEGTIDPVRKFMKGPQKAIFDEAMRFIQTQESNFAYLGGTEHDQIKSMLNDPDCFKGNRMQQIKTLLESLQTTLDSRIQSEVQTAVGMVQALQAKLTGMEEFKALTDDKQSVISQPFETFSKQVATQTLIPVIRDSLRRFEVQDYPQQLSRLSEWSQPQPNPDSARGSDVTGHGIGSAGTTQPGATATGHDSTGSAANTSTHTSIPIAPAKVEFVPGKSIHVSFDKAWLADESDVDQYMKALREAYLEQIRHGKRIQI